MGFTDFVKAKVKEHNEKVEVRRQTRMLLEKQFEESSLVQTIIYYLKANSGMYHFEDVPCSDELSWAFLQQEYKDNCRRDISIDGEAVLLLWYEFVKVRDAEGTHTERKMLGEWGVSFTSMGYAPLDKMIFEGVTFSKGEVIDIFTDAFVKAFSKAFPNVGPLAEPSYSDYSLYFGGFNAGYMISYKAQEKQWKLVL